MSIWIVTIGNSDIILKHDQNWNTLYQEVVDDLECPLFASATRINPDDKNKGYTVPARVLGYVYGNQADYHQDLDFPLLNTFYQFFADSQYPKKIIVILTDQQEIFSEDERVYKDIPYWQDTCNLQLILARFFQEKFPELKEGKHIQYMTLSPKPDDTTKYKGLDDWDKVLALVQKEFARLNNIDEQSIVYVSHQAGTPAISSAVQFISLAKFGQQVKFLVSSEYDKGQYQDITSSNYLRGIQFEKAKQLLERFDYSGVESLLKPYLTNSTDKKLQKNIQKIRNLTGVAQVWNCAKFDKFKKFVATMGKTEQKRSEKWWWAGYEAAYLAVIRLEQGNTVEAVFHSFRALEGLICKWIVVTYPSHVEKNHNKKGESFNVKDTILSILPNLPTYYQNGLVKSENRTKGLYGDFAYQILLASRPELDNNKHLKEKIWNVVREERNALFHQLLGLEEIEVFQAWDTQNQEEWETRVLGCLNFISGENFNSLQSASLMSQVHQELQNAIALYESTIYKES